MRKDEGGREGNRKERTKGEVKEGEGGGSGVREKDGKRL